MDNSAGRKEQKDFLFREIELLRSEVLGAGSYGKVCRATCDGLPCAAKIIHSTLFDLKDPGLASFVAKFNAECLLLSRVRHPNIVLYLATYSDPVTKLPVLLMELCDQSLTKFLDRFSRSLPFHTQVDITHDVALALVYLHANEVIHRDLTSNNVLMIAGCRAKVTDFGMSRLANVNPRMTPLTLCPGNLLYMSPEALNEDPSYTTKLDVFSLGVLVVQILTRLFPAPTARFKVLDVSQDPRFTCSTVNAPVDETDRRSNHLDLIHERHPLKTLALSCLKDTEVLRPSAQELSETLRDLKQSREYSESIELWCDGERGAVGGGRGEGGANRARLNSLRLQVQDLKQKEMKQQQRLSRQQEEFASAQRQMLQETEEEVQQLQAVVAEQERELREARSRREKEKAPRALVEAKDRELESVRQKGLECEITENKLRALVDVRDSELQNSGRMLQAKVREVSELQRTLSALRLSENRPTANPRPLQRDPHSPHVGVHLERRVAAPYAVRRGASAVYQTTAFIAPESSNKIYQITLGVDRWNVLPVHPHFSLGLAVFEDGCVTTVGGWTGVTYSNQLLTLNQERRWVAQYPVMPTARIEAAVVNTPHMLVVAGGYNGGQAMLDNVEVLTLYNMQWATASPLPHPFYMASSVLCGDQLYLAGGYVAPEVKSRSVLTCSITDLLHSLPTAQDRGIHRGQVWREARRVPNDKCTLVSASGGRLVAVGGKGEGGEVTTNLLLYDPRTDSWRHISDLIVPRHQCFALSFPGDLFYIVGGEPQNFSTEIMKVVERL